MLRLVSIRDKQEAIVDEITCMFSEQGGGGRGGGIP